MFRLSLHRVGLVSNIFKKTRTPLFDRLMSNVSTTDSDTPQNSFLSIYEPDYLDDLAPEIPIYDLVNVQMKGYDYPILENYQKFVHRIAATLRIATDDSWATPPQKLQITKLEPNSSVVEATYHLNLYERNVQVQDIPSNVLPIFIESIQAGLPEGVNMQVLLHTDDQDEARYIPDLTLKELEQKLDELGGPREPKMPTKKR